MKLALKLVITCLLFAGLFWKIGGAGPIWTALLRLDALLLLCVFALFHVDRLLMAFMWCRLLRAKGLELPLLTGTQIYCTSMLLGFFLPATVGADAVRAFTTMRRGFDGNTVVASIAVERVFGFLSTLLLGLFGVVWISLHTELSRELQLVAWAAALFLLAGVLLALASFSTWLFTLFHDRILQRFRTHPLVQRLRALHENYRAYQTERGTLAFFFVLSGLKQLLPGVIVWLLLGGLGFDISFMYVCGATALAFTAARLPLSLSGLGVYEGSLLGLLALVGVPAAEAVTVGLVSRVLEIACWLLWWFAWTLRTGGAERPRTSEAATP